MDNETREYSLYMHKTPNAKRYIGITRMGAQKRWGTTGCGYKTQAHFWRAIQKYGWDNITHIILIECLTKAEAYYLEKKFIAHFKTYDKRYGYNVSKGGDDGLSVPVDCYDIKGNFLKSYSSVRAASNSTRVSHTGIYNSANGLALSAGGYIWRKKGESIDLYPLPKLSKYMEFKLCSKQKIYQYDREMHLVHTYNNLKELASKTSFRAIKIFEVLDDEHSANSAYGYYWSVTPLSKKYLANYNVINKRDGGFILETINVHNSRCKYRNQKVYKYSFNGNLVASYNDVYQIECTPQEREKIVDNLRHRRNSYHGYIYSFDLQDNLKHSRQYYTSNNAILVDCFTLDGNFVKTYPSISAAQAEIGREHIADVCNGKRKTCGGYVWKYHKEIKTICKQQGA